MCPCRSTTGRCRPATSIALGANPTVVARLTGADPTRVREVARTAASPGRAAARARAAARRSPTCSASPRRRTGGKADAHALQRGALSRTARACASCSRRRASSSRQSRSTSPTVRRGSTRRTRPGASPWSRRTTGLAAGVGGDHGVPRGALSRARAAGRGSRRPRARAALDLPPRRLHGSVLRAAPRRGRRRGAFDAELAKLDARSPSGRGSAAREYGLADIAYVPWLLRARDMLGVQLDGNVAEWLGACSSGPRSPRRRRSLRLCRFLGDCDRAPARRRRRVARDAARRGRSRRRRRPRPERAHARAHPRLAAARARLAAAGRGRGDGRGAREGGRAAPAPPRDHRPERLVLVDRGDGVGAMPAAQMARARGPPAGRDPRSAASAAGRASSRRAPVELSRCARRRSSRARAFPTRQELARGSTIRRSTILDVRREEEYTGKAGSPCDPRQGHIPGAQRLEVGRCSRGRAGRCRRSDPRARRRTRGSRGRRVLPLRLALGARDARAPQRRLRRAQLRRVVARVEPPRRAAARALARAKRIK